MMSKNKFIDKIARGVSMKPVFGSAVFMAMVFMLNACTYDDHVVDSSGLATSEIEAYIHVRYDGSQVVTIDAQLYKGYPRVNLVDGDILRVSTVGDTSQLNYSDNLFGRLLELSDQVKILEQVRGTYNISYYTTIDAKYRDKEFTVALIRNNEQDAPNSIVKLPPDFSVSIDQMQNNTTLSRSGPMTVRWTPANLGYDMEVSGSVTCDNGDDGVWYAGRFTNQTDNYEIAAGKFSNYTGNCTVTIDVESSHRGEADPALFFASYIQSHRIRSIAVATTE